MEPDRYIRALAAESLARDDATGWWDTLYEAAGDGVTEIPWDRDGPHLLLASWVADRPDSAQPAGRHHGQRGQAVVVGAGLGGDAEFLAAQGWRTTAFDVSPTAVHTARERYPDSTVDYLTADLFDLPERLIGAFDLVLESMTVQAMPRALRERAIAAVRTLVAPGGTLLVIAAAFGPAEPDPDEPDPGGPESAEGPPWPLTRADVDAFASADLVPVRVEQFEHNGGRRWRAELSAGRSR